MTVVFSVSCSDELKKAMKEKHISPSEALKVGALRLLGEPFTPERGVSISETEKGRISKVQTAMQGAINVIEEEKEVLQTKLNVLEKEKSSNA